MRNLIYPSNVFLYFNILLNFGLMSNNNFQRKPTLRQIISTITTKVFLFMSLSLGIEGLGRAEEHNGVLKHSF